MIRFALFFLIFAPATWGLHASGADSRSSEQTEFSAEDAGVQKPVHIPPDVLAILKTDDQVASEIENDPDEKFSASWFSASAIHLGPSNRADLIVVAEPPITGANVTLFWVFRSTANGGVLVLRAGGHSLAIKRSRSNGYRDIETYSVTVQMFNSDLYKFDGKTYRSVANKTETIP